MCRSYFLQIFTLRAQTRGIQWNSVITISNDNFTGDKTNLINQSSFSHYNANNVSIVCRKEKIDFSSLALRAPGRYLKLLKCTGFCTIYTTESTK